MGSKNRKYLGIVSSIILHNIRNTFPKKIFITNKTIEKIQIKHSPLDKEYIHNDNFQTIIDNTIMIYYDQNKRTYNCLSKINTKFLIYGMVPKNNRTEISTLFYTYKRQLEKDFYENENAIEIKI